MGKTRTMPDENLAQDTDLSLVEHLEELRVRLIRCLVAITLGFGISYPFKEKLFDILIAPLVDAALATPRAVELLKTLNAKSNIVYTGLAEPFFVYLKVALLCGFLLALPFIIFEFWRFVSPGLYKKEKKFLIPIIFLSIVFFVLGALFAYFIACPWGFRFLLSFAQDLTPFLSMKEYFAFASRILLAFGLSFELPLVLTGLARIGVVTPAFLAKNRKYAVLIAFIVAAILTPPDVASQIMLGVPLVFMYELGIIGARMAVSGKKDADGADEASEET